MLENKSLGQVNRISFHTRTEFCFFIVVCFAVAENMWDENEHRIILWHERRWWWRRRILRATMRKTASDEQFQSQPTVHRITNHMMLLYYRKLIALNMPFAGKKKNFLMKYEIFRLNILFAWKSMKLSIQQQQWTEPTFLCTHLCEWHVPDIAGIWINNISSVNVVDSYAPFWGKHICHIHHIVSAHGAFYFLPRKHETTLDSSHTRLPPAQGFSVAVYEVFACQK